MHCNAAETLAWLWFLHQEKICPFYQEFAHYGQHTGGVATRDKALVNGSTRLL
uniref:Uncharacterized protein n=1 Tax=Anguilla anguilla TaxID=7936 RepID=A0A0E9WRN7_ANGAN